MEEKDLMLRIRKMEYHMRLMAEALADSQYEFNKLVISRNLSEQETARFYSLCEKMNNLFEEQKAEGFLNFHPLFQEFSDLLPSKLNPREVVHACLRQKLFVSLMNEFKKYI